MKIRFLSQAEAELVEATEWYEARAAGLGAEFLRALDAAVASVQRNPLGYQIIFKNARRVLLRRFPYSVIYSVLGDEIVIISCIHGKRDPKRWQERA